MAIADPIRGKFVTDNVLTGQTNIERIHVHEYIFFEAKDHKFLRCIYRLTHTASELSAFTCTSSLTMNEKFQYRKRPPCAVLKISCSTNTPSGFSAYKS